jgi:hypothetical protein
MNEVEIVVTSKDKSAPGLRKARDEVDHLHRSVGRASVGFRAFGGFFRTAVSGIAAAGVVGFAAVTAEVIRSTKGWADHQAIARDTANTIKSTGGAAKVTAKEVGDLADAIEMKTTKDGDAIQTGANMLLTFKDIRNEAGKDNDIFNQATSILTDMTAKMNQGKVTNENMSSSAVQLGKALNDPIAGISALSRVGVTFTQGQKDQIKALVKAGDTMGAQKIILHELSDEFSGAAKASAKPWDGVLVALRKVEDAIGAFLLPKVQALSNWVTGTGLPALRDLKKEWDHNKESIKKLADIIASQFVPQGDSAKTTVDNLKNSFTSIEDVLDHVILGVANIILWWLKLEEKTLHLQFVVENFGIGVGLVTNALDKLSGGSGHAADGMIAALRSMKKGTEEQLSHIRDQINTTQGVIDTMHGRILDIEARDRASAVIQHIKDQMNSMPGVQVSTVLYGGRYQHGTMFVPQTGPALVHKGEIVVPARESEAIRQGRAMLGSGGAGGGGGGGGGVVVLEINSGGSRLDDLLVEVLRKSIRSKGGDVQVVLGT